MDDDFNTADAIAAIFELVKYANTTATAESSKEYLRGLLDRIVKLGDVLGLILDKKEELLDADIEKLIEERQAARKAKDFARADAIRDELLEKGLSEGYQRRSTMEKSVEFEIADYIKEVLEMKEVEPKAIHLLPWLISGDSIYDLIIKTKVISEGNKQVKKLHQETSSMVQASAQSEMMRALQPLLTEEEHAVYRRGRNAKSVSPAKNQSLTDYRRATGFEALMGWLYLKREWKRMADLIKIGLDHLSECEEEKEAGEIEWKKKKMNSQQIEGRNAVMEAFRSGKPIDKVYILDGCQDGPIRSIVREAKKHDTILNFVTKERLNQISETGRHQGSLHRQRLTSMRRWKICWSLQNRKGKILF